MLLPTLIVAGVCAVALRRTMTRHLSPFRKYPITRGRMPAINQEGARRG